MEKSSGVILEFKDLDTTKGTAVIMHSVYNSIDRANDMAHKGMFNRSWNAGLPKFYINHEIKSIPGKSLRVFEDNKGAYTEVKFGNWTMGKDALEMADAGIFTGASFGYVAQKKDYSTANGVKVRHLREVMHDETSLLTVLACHPEAGLVTLNKAFDELEIKQLTESEQTFLKQLLLNDQASIEAMVQLMATVQPESDLYMWVAYQVSYRADRMSSIMSQLKWNNDQIKNMKAHIVTIESWASKAKSSDESIIAALNSIQEYKQIISQYDIATTHTANDQVASDGNSIQSFLNSLNIETWRKQSLSN